VRRILLATDGVDWHTRELLRGFAEAGAEAVPVPLRACMFSTATASGLELPGFDDALPDAAFVRVIAAGSFEEVTRRLGVLHALHGLGVPVWNDACAIERCVDKSMTTFLLGRAGVPTPPTWTVEGLDAARAVVAREAPRGRLVMKPLFGAQGRGLQLIAAPEELPEPDAVRGVYYLQRYVPPGGTGFHDHRLLVSAGRVLAAMTRRAEAWITNLHRGGQAEPLTPDAELAAVAVRAAAAVGARYAGVDVLRDAEGRAFVLEVNSMPAWKGLQSVSDLSIARALAGAVLDTVR
jgi:RimK family alpha-L-glutamate ligase